MFGRKSKTETRIEQLEERLAKNSTIIQEDHDALVELKLRFDNLKNIFDAMNERMDGIAERQQELRNALLEAVNQLPSRNND